MNPEGAGDTEKVTEEGAEKAAQEGGEEASQEGGEEASQEGAEEASKEGAEEVAQEGDEEASKEGAEEVAQEGGEEASKEGAEEVAQEGDEEAAQEGSEEAAQEGTEEVAQEGSEEASQEGGEEAAQEGAEEVPGEGADIPALQFIDPNQCNHSGDTYTVMWPRYETAAYQKVDATTHRVTYETDKVVRCLSCGLELKREPGTPHSYTQNHYYNTDGVCACGDRVEVESGKECEHKNTTVWAMTETINAESMGPGFHQVTLNQKNQKVCLDCGKVLEEYEGENITRVEPHYITAGVCDTCKYENTCTHSEEDLAQRTILLGTALVMDVSKTGHVMQRDSMIETYCTQCGDVLWVDQSNVVKQEENHMFADGKCIDCGYEIDCSHAHKKAQSGVMTTEDSNYTYVDEKTHKVNVYEGTWYTCLDCGESWFEENSGAKTITEPHTYSGGTCYCGAKNSCAHSGGIEKILTQNYASLVSSNASGHTIRYSQYWELCCADCGELINIQMDYEQVEKTSAHTYADGKCSECGYVKPAPAPDPEPTVPATTPAATQPTEPEATEPVFTEVASDEPVHGVKVSDNLTMTETVTKVIEDIETSETAKIQIRNVDQILNQEEVKQMEAIPVKEQVFAFLTVMGFGDTIEKALDEADEQMSQKTLSLIESIQTRMDSMTQQERKEFNKVLEELFPITKVVIDGVEYEWFQFEIQVEDGDTVRIERYGFRLEDGEWILSRLETADVEK